MKVTEQESKLFTQIEETAKQHDVILSLQLGRRFYLYLKAKGAEEDDEPRTLVTEDALYDFSPVKKGVKVCVLDNAAPWKEGDQPSE
jgi:hypothetical protein